MTERFHGHDRGVVITQREPGVFAERPMTIGELAARGPAAKFQDDIFRLANQAGVCYYELWKDIAAAIDEAITKNGWIPVADFKPTPGVKVFARFEFTHGPDCEPLVDYGDATWLSVDGGRWVHYLQGTLTHVMEIPK